MSKTVKFNLNIDGVAVRTLEELREHFCIQDVLKYYKNGLLTRWFQVRDFKEEFEKIQKIASTNDEEIISKLIEILHIELDDDELKESLAYFVFEKNIRKSCDRYANGCVKQQDVLDDYRKNYDEIIQKIVDNKNNYPAIKAAVKILAKNFMWLLKVDYERLFFYMRDNAPMALFAFAANDGMRHFYIPEDVTRDNGEVCMDFEVQYENSQENYFYQCKKNLYAELTKLISEEKLREILGEYLRENNENTNDFWRDLEPKGKKFLILGAFNNGTMYLPNCLVRSTGNLGEELNVSDIKDRFRILNGIDFKNQRKDILCYMEV